MNATENNLVIIHTSNTDHAMAKFIWSEDMSDCDVVAYGVDDDTLSAMLAAKAHEGVDFPGFTCNIPD